MNRLFTILTGPVLLVLTLVLLGSCGGDDTPTAPNGSGDQHQTPTITLAQAQASPLAPVRITGLPANRDDLYALASVSAPDSGKGITETTHTAFIERQDDGQYYLTTPFHPATPKEGGSVFIQVTNGTTVISTVAILEIGGLPEADGAFEGMVGSLQRMLDGWLPVHRTTRAALRSTSPDNFPDNWYPLFMAQDVIDSPDNPNSLRAIADGTAPLISGTDFDRDLLDRVIGFVGMQELLDLDVAYLDTITAWGDTLEGGGPASLVKQQPQGAFTIGSAAQLDYYMSMANNSRSRTEGAPGDILKGMGLGLGALGILTGGNPVVGAVGAGMWAYQTLEESKAKLLPSTFEHSATSVEFEKTFFLEDEPGPAKWSQFMIAGRSEGMKLDKAILEGIMQFAGLRGQFGDWIDGFSVVKQEVGKFALGEGSNALIGAADSGFIEIPPRVWPSVDASDPSFFDSKINAGSAIDIVFWDYWPDNVGKATVQVGTRSGKFGFQGTLVHQEMVVEAIRVEITPEAKNVEPGETVDFTATVTFAEDETLEWTTTGGTLNQTTNLTATLKTPGEPWEDPIVVKAEAVTKAGIRGQPGAPERSATAVVSSQEGEIIIDPLFDCVKPGEPKGYSAVIVGFPPEDQEVMWLAERGSFNGSTYTAPSTPGEDVITARSVVDPKVEGIAYVQVSECICWFNANLFGEISMVYTGEFAVLESNQALSVLSLAVTDDTQFPSMIGQVYPGIPVGATGQFPIQMSFSPDISTIYIGTDDEDSGTTAPTLNLITNSNGKVEGFITGQVHRYDSEGIAGSINLDIHVRGEAGSTLGGNGCWDGTK